MGWFDGITNIFTGGGLGGTLLRTVSMGYLLNKVSSSAVKGNDSSSSGSFRENAPGIDNGVRLQVDPAPDERIPVLYGSAVFGGIINEAVMSNSNQKMTYVLTLAEKTGTLLSNAAATSYSCSTIYWDDNQVYLKADGLTIDYTVDRAGNRDESLRDLVKIYLYAGNTTSTSQFFPDGYSGTQVNAYSIVPNWNSGYQMSNLIFAVVEVNYSAERNVKGLGDVKFKLTSSMNKPGDVIYDYFTNNIYGANIANVSIDTTSLGNLNTYSATSINYTDQTYGNISLANRYQINGLVNTDQPVMTNVENLASTAGSWLSYSILTGKWGVIINRSGTSVASFDDSNILGSISVSGTGLRDLYNTTKAEFPHRDIRDVTDYVSISIPSGDRNANEQDNTLNLTYNYLNEPIQAQLLSFIELKQSRIDLIIKFQADYTTINLNAGDIIDVTNSKLGFSSKLFRIITVAEQQGDDALMTEITALEYDSEVYDETNLYRYTRTLSNGLTTVGNIGIPSTPTITKYELASRPRIEVSTTAPSGTIEGMEYWLSNDTGVGEAQRSYRLIATKVPTNGNANVRGTYTTGDTITLDYDTIGTSNLVIKTRAYNSTTVGPFSSNSAITSFTSRQATDAILPTTAVYDELGGLATAYGIVTLLNNLDDLFGNSATSAGGVFDKIKQILFPGSPIGETAAEDILANSASFANTIQSVVTSPSVISNISSFTSNLGTYSIDALADVNTTTVAPAVNNLLGWDGSNWKPVVIQGNVSLSFPGYIPPGGGGGDGGGGGGNVVTPTDPFNPGTGYLGISSVLPQDYAHWTSSTQEITWVAPNQAPTTGSYYVYWKAEGLSPGNGIFANIAIGSGNAKLYKSDGTLVETVSSSSMIPQGNRLEIPFATREAGVNYYILLDAGLVTYCDRSSIGVTLPTTWNFNTPYYPISAYTAPAGTIDTFTDPTDYAEELTITAWSHDGTSSNMCTNASLELTFSEAVTAGSGIINIIETSEGGFELAPAANIAASSGVVTGNKINYGVIPNLGYGKWYKIVVPSGAANTNRPGYGFCSVFLSPTQIPNTVSNRSFNTRTKIAYASYELVSVSGNATVISDPTLNNVSLESDLGITFNKAFTLASGDPLNVSIYESNGTLHQTFNLKSAFNGTSDFTSEIIRFSGNTIYFNPTRDFKPNTSYYATIAANVVTDGCSFNDAVTDPNTIRWTVLGNLAISSSQPVQGSNNNTINETGIEINFGQAIEPGTGNISIYNSANVLIANISPTNGNLTYA